MTTKTQKISKGELDDAETRYMFDILPQLRDSRAGFPSAEGLEAASRTGREGNVALLNAVSEKVGGPFFLPGEPGMIALFADNAKRYATAPTSQPWVPEVTTRLTTEQRIEALDLPAAEKAQLRDRVHANRHKDETTRRNLDQAASIAAQNGGDHEAAIVKDHMMAGGVRVTMSDRGRGGYQPTGKPEGRPAKVAPNGSIQDIVAASGLTVEQLRAEATARRKSPAFVQGVVACKHFGGPELSRLLGCSKMTISRILRKAGEA